MFVFALITSCTYSGGCHCEYILFSDSTENHYCYPLYSTKEKDLQPMCNDIQREFEYNDSIANFECVFDEYYY